MANPNLLGITNVLGITTNVGIASNFSTVLSNAASSGKLYKIVSFLASNTGNATASVNINLNNQAAGAGSSTVIAKNLSVSTGSIQIVFDKGTPLFIQENKSIVASASTSVDVTISYEEIS